MKFLLPALCLASLAFSQESHYSPLVKVRTLLRSDTTSDGARIAYPAAGP